MKVTILSKMKKEKIFVKGTEVTIFSKFDNWNYICITDIARYKNSVEPKDVVKNWMRNRTTIEFLGLWEKLNNPDFKGVEFDPLWIESGSNSFTMSPTRWVEVTNAIGIFTRTGSGGGTYAHEDIAFEFASWISSEFKLYLITEFKRLKEDENRKLSLEWNLQRTLSKINYRIHTEAISLNYDYYEFLDYPDFWSNSTHGNHENLINHSLDNMESINALLIRQGLSQGERLVQLNSVAITQMRSLLSNRELKR